MFKSIKKANEFVLYRFLIAVLRRSYRKTPVYRNALSAAKEEYFIPAKNGGEKRRVHYKCATCGRLFHNRPGAKEIAVDHIDPVVDPSVGFVDYDTLIDRLFNGKVQVLCNYKGERDGKRSCHYQKTKAEREILKETNRKLKDVGKHITTKER
ncbi:hypothetical protein UFOVP244_42 [uncultured Caudovirales phage]|uniref:HNHc domain containing protein n=1 Tax=uncultured Caudovirales phage TaxID=2100421 RepID=A0A6J7WSX4_9CAUD|nr:hypothetical protein UFOVP244_42 [uncultured Caudovirales phage]